MSRFLSVLTLLALLLLPSALYADANSMFTLGAGVGYTYTGSRSLDSVNDSNMQVSVRAKVLKILGSEFVFQPNLNSDATGLSEEALRYRVNALIYMMNRPRFGLYTSAGMASARAEDLFNWQGESTYYRAGAGVEYIVRGRYAFTLEGAWALPGVHQLRQNASEAFDDVMEETIGDAMDTLDEAKLSLPSLGSIAGQRGFELMAGFRLYI